MNSRTSVRRSTLASRQNQAPSASEKVLLSALIDGRRSIHAIRAIGVLIVLWYERLVFRFASQACFPGSSDDVTQFPLTILADPQIIDRYSYAHTQGLPFGLSRVTYNLVRWAADTYVRKAYGAVVQRSGRARSEAVIWLGDLLDGGRRSWQEDKRREARSYARHVRRFRSLFPERLPSVYVPGNHDVRIPITHQPQLEIETAESRQRWIETWGTWFEARSGRWAWSLGERTAGLTSKSDGKRVELYAKKAPLKDDSQQWQRTVNAKFEVYLDKSRNSPTHEIVLVDALELAGIVPAGTPEAERSLVDVQGMASWQAALRRFQQTTTFVQDSDAGSVGIPPLRILVSHIPLWRDAKTSCTLNAVQSGQEGRVHILDAGWHRETVGQIDQGVDRYATYQNTLSRPVTEWLLERTRPDLIFSGDNHDHCHVHHTFPGRATGAHELTLKAFSMTGGVRRPGYARLALSYNEQNGEAQATAKPCALPDQIAIWTSSYPLAVLALSALLLIERFLQKSLLRHHKGRSHDLPSLTGSRKRDTAATEIRSLKVELVRIFASPLLAWLYFQLF